MRTLTKILSASVLAIGVLVAMALPASAASVYHPRGYVEWSYSCQRVQRQPLAYGLRGFYDEICSITVTDAGPNQGFQIDINGFRHEQAVIQTGAAHTVIDGVPQPQGMGSGGWRIGLPYTVGAGNPTPAGYVVTYWWNILLLNQPYPSAHLGAVLTSAACQALTR